MLIKAVFVLLLVVLVCVHSNDKKQCACFTVLLTLFLEKLNVHLFNDCLGWLFRARAAHAGVYVRQPKINEKRYDDPPPCTSCKGFQSPSGRRGWRTTSLARVLFACTFPPAATRIATQMKTRTHAVRQAGEVRNSRKRRQPQLRKNQHKERQKKTARAGTSDE